MAIMALPMMVATLVMAAAPGGADLPLRLLVLAGPRHAPPEAVQLRLLQLRLGAHRTAPRQASADGLVQAPASQRAPTTIIQAHWPLELPGAAARR